METEKEDGGVFLTKMIRIAQQPQGVATVGEVLHQLLMLACTQGESKQWNGASREQIISIFKEECTRLMKSRISVRPTVRIT